MVNRHGCFVPVAKALAMLKNFALYASMYMDAAWLHRVADPLHYMEILIYET